MRRKRKNFNSSKSPAAARADGAAIDFVRKSGKGPVSEVEVWRVEEPITATSCLPQAFEGIRVGEGRGGRHFYLLNWTFSLYRSINTLRMEFLLANIQMKNQSSRAGSSVL